MLRQKFIYLCLCLVSLIFISACSPGKQAVPSEDMLSSEAIEKTRLTQGYALAPTYMPEGFDYDAETGNNGAMPNMITKSRVQQVYIKECTGGQPIYLLMIYPLASPDAGYFDKQIGLEIPEDAISRPEINGQKAYLIRGSWSTETRKRITQGEESIDTEWDYDVNNSIRFTVDVPGKGAVWVTVSPVSPVAEISGEELIRIAESVVAIR